MKSVLKVIASLVLLLVLLGAGVGAWYVYTKQPVRSGLLPLAGLKERVSVAYDERGVPHITAKNEADLYRALGYVHAQDRLFQMEIVRRLAQGELAEVLGPKLLDTDKLFRTLGIRAHAVEYVKKLDRQRPEFLALAAYLDGINQFQATHKPPIEFDVLGIPKRPFTAEDTVAVSGYLAFSFAAAFKTEPVMTYIRDELGPEYLKAFDIDWHPEGVLAHAKPDPSHWQSLTRIAQAGQDAMALAGVPLFEGSNAWAIAGRRTVSGKPLLAGDPHVGFSVPAVWYEAQLNAPGFELYGHFQALNPMALIGHNTQFGWSLTMFQNDDVDLIAEKINPANPQQVWFQDQWVDMETRTESIAVKGRKAVKLTLRRSPHGPIITDAFKDALDSKPVAMWWAYLETPNPMLEAFYGLNRADTREKARNAASKIDAPGLNIVWANAKGDIAWWAAAKLPIRPPGVNPTFILDASKGEAEKKGFYAFNYNPQEENPLRGYVVSANSQPKPPSGVPVPGYYNLADRAKRLDQALKDPERKWDVAAAQALQLDVTNDYGPRILKSLLPVLQTVVTDANEKAFLEPLEKWDGSYTRDSIAATLFSQFSYELAKAAMEDELGPVLFSDLLETRALDSALPLLAADPNSPWWDNIDTKKTESHFETVRVAWHNTLTHLTDLYGSSLLAWSWGQTHTLTHVHPLGRQKPLDLLFNVGEFAVPGGRETPNNLSLNVGPAPWAVSYGPSTRRVVDFAAPHMAMGINPVGQSGVLFDAHYADQAQRYAEGIYVQQYLSEADVKAHTKSTLTLRPDN
ncbi:penicillin acylase family protein [Rhodoferax aquaticus]|uniref:Penicillin acylase family protein n=1 Tax=Rhodoferax aquaticus TaxID=2527691 RepID=A0A515EMW5_9BURK|nr:penicillin acylase family protein [Rhodoferax aquaticus]QDL54017.1 penicillin acylase family protein [Rhodoferax aquaticus]